MDDSRNLGYKELVGSVFRASLLVGLSIGILEAALIAFKVLANNTWDLSLIAGLIRFLNLSAGLFGAFIFVISFLAASLAYLLFKTQLMNINHKAWLLRFCWFLGIAFTVALWSYFASSRHLLSVKFILYLLGAVVAATVLAEILTRMFQSKVDKIILTKPGRPRSVAFVWLAALILAFVPILTKEGMAEGDKPNVILLIVDTLRADRLGCYGYTKDTTPNIDRIAKQGVIFDQAYVQWASSLPSHSSIMTSMYPHVHGAFPNGRSLNSELMTLPKVLKAHGYKNGGFVTNVLVGHEYNFEAGFDTFTDLSKIDYRNTNASMWVQSLNLIRLVDGLKGIDFFTELSVHWIDHNKKEPFFLWLQWLHPHAPYKPPKAFLKRFESTYSGIADGTLGQINRISNKELRLNEEDQKHYEALYDGEVAASDHEIGRVIRKLEALDLLKNSLLIITSDHGENLYEHDMEYGHYGTYDSSIRIPVIFVMPEVITDNKDISEVVESIDIAPTILDLIGIEAPGQFQGRSMRPLIQGDSPDWSSVAVSMMFRDDRNFFALRSDDWKIILDSRTHGKTFELYHIPSDPNEMTNLFEKEHGIADSLKLKLVEWIEREFGNVELAYTPGKILKKEFDEQTIEHLRSLGYIK